MVDKLINLLESIRGVEEFRTYEQELRYGRERLELAQQAAGIGTFDWNLLTNEVYWSRVLEQMHGLQPDSFEGDFRAWMQRIHPEDRARITRSLQTCTRDGLPFSLEYRIVLPDGAIRLVSCVGKVLCNDDQEPMRAVGVNIDVTSRHLMEQEKSRLLWQLQGIIRNMDEGLMIANPAGVIVEMNPVALTVHDFKGFPEAQAAFCDYARMFEFRDADGRPLDARRLPLARALAGESFSNEQYAVCNRVSGRQWYGRFGGTPVRNDQGGIELAIVTLRDITEDKRREEELRCATERISQILESITDGFVSWDHEWRFIYMNSAAARVLNVDAGDVVGRRFSEVFPEALTTRFWPAFQHALHSSSPMQLEEYYEPLDRWFECRCYPTADGLSMFFSDTTERRLSEQELRESEERFRAVLEQSLDAAYRRDLWTDQFDYMSPVIERIIGFTPEQMNTMTTADIIDRIHPEDRARVIQEMEEALKQGRGIIEYRMRTRQGDYRWLSDHFSVLRDENGVPRHRGGTVRDITAQKAAQDALAASEQRYRQLVNLMPAALYACDAQGRITYYNQRAAEIWRRRPEIGGNDDIYSAAVRLYDVDGTFIPVEESPVALAIREGVTTHGRMMIAETADGSQSRISVNVEPLYDEKGGIVGALNVFQDVTDVIKAQEALRESKERLRGFFDANDVYFGVLELLDGDFRFVLPNRRLAEMFDGTVQSVAGLTAGELGLSKPLIREWVLMMRDCLDRGRPVSREYRVRINRERHWQLGTISQISAGPGRVPRFALTAFDTTNRHKLETELRTLNRQLEDKVAERTALAERRAQMLQVLAQELAQAEDQERRRLAEILHDDFQQLLVAAKFQLSLLVNRSREDQNVRTMVMNVMNLLDETIVKSRNLSHELSPPTLKESGLVSAMQWLARQMEEKHGLKVELEVDDAFEDCIPESEAVMIFLFRAVQEMLFNVVTHAGTRRARVEAGVAGRGIRLDVVDEGAGFDPDRLFRAGQGGYGLISIRERLAYMGGKLTVESEPDRGSRMGIYFPTNGDGIDSKSVGSDPRRRRAEHGAPQSETAGEDARAIRVLLVDDHRIMREGLAALLTDEPDLEIVGEADNGKEAVDLVQRARPDVVIMDVSMPVMNGIEATRIIKRLYPHVRVIALSMFQEEDMSKGMVGAGAETYLNKMGPAEQLINVIRKKN